VKSGAVVPLVRIPEAIPSLLLESQDGRTRVSILCFVDLQ
jgi:hypothetical protein